MGDLKTTKIEVGFKQGVNDARGEGVCSQIKDFLNISAKALQR